MALSLSMIGTGVAVGASRPFQPTLTTPGTVSSMVGVSGSSGRRVFSATAMMRMLPTCACGSATGSVLKATLTLPAMRSCIKAAPHVHHVDPDFLLDQLTQD